MHIKIVRFFASAGSSGCPALRVDRGLVVVGLLVCCRASFSCVGHLELSGVFAWTGILRRRSLLSGWSFVASKDAKGSGFVCVLMSGQAREKG